MFLLLSIASLQTIFIPGFILYFYLFKDFKNKNLIHTLVFSFFLSQLINYLIVSTLVSFGLYTRQTIFSVIVLELFSLMCMCISSRRRNELNIWVDFFTPNIEWGPFWNSIENTNSLSLKTIKMLSLLIGTIGIYLILKNAIHNVGNIFTGWDAVVSWNRWAVDLYNNRLPNYFAHYPQLLPANWSITYKILDNPLQFVPRAYMPLFLISISSIVFYTAIKRISIGLLLTPALFYYAFREFAWTDGWTDTPVAAFAFISIFSLYLSEDSSDKEEASQLILLGSILACASAVTKQAGIFCLILYPIFTYITHKNNTLFSRRTLSYLLLKYLFLILIIVAPFYIYTTYRINSGTTYSNIYYLTHSIHGKKTYLERFSHANSIYFSSLMQFICLFFWTISISRKNFWRPIGLFLTLPFYLLYAFFYSYDARNAALFLPTFYIGSALGFNQLITLATTQSEKTKRILKIGTLILILVILILAKNKFDKKHSRQRITTIHTEKEKLLGNVSLNQKLYNYHSEFGINKIVVTNYQYFGYLPELKEKYQLNHFNSIPIEDLENDKVGFFLITPYTNKAVIDFMNKKIIENSFIEIFTYGQFKFVKIR